MKGFKLIFLVMFASLAVAFLWDNIPIIKDSVHFVLNPTAGKLLDLNVVFGLLIITAFLALVTTLFQKYTTDQATLKALKEEQKKLQEDIKTYKEHPDKLMHSQKRQLEIAGEMIPLTMRPLIFTSIPFILFIRWFSDYFIGNPVKVLGMNWIWAYLIFSIIFSSIFRKILKVH